jgi:hypothetical protein
MDLFSSSGEVKKTPTLLGSLKGNNFNHWARHVIINTRNSLITANNILKMVTGLLIDSNPLYFGSLMNRSAKPINKVNKFTSHIKLTTYHCVICVIWKNNLICRHTIKEVYRYKQMYPLHYLPHSRFRFATVNLDSAQQSIWVQASYTFLHKAFLQ